MGEVRCTGCCDAIIPENRGTGSRQSVGVMVVPDDRRLLPDAFVAKALHVYRFSGVSPVATRGDAAPLTLTGETAPPTVDEQTTV